MHFKGLSRVLSKTTVQKHQFLGTQLYLWSNSHIHSRLLEKAIALTIRRFTGKGMSLFFSMLSRFFIVYFPRNKSLFSTAAVTMCSDYGSQKTKSVTVFIVSPSMCHEVMELHAIILILFISTYHIKAIHKKMKCKKAI